MPCACGMIATGKGDSMKKKNCTDWDRIKSDYITGNESPKECARKHGVNYNTLRNHKQRERWRQQRTKYRGEVTDKAIETAKNCTAYSIASELTGLAYIVEALERELIKALQDEEQFHRYFVQSTTRHKDGTAETAFKDVTSAKVDTRALKDLTDVAKTLEALKRSLYGLETAQEQHRKQIELERLELERERLALERERVELVRKREERDAEGVKGVQILVGGYCDDYSE